MKFEELATKAGQEAQRIATTVAAPSLSEARSRRILRRSRVVAAGAVLAVAAVFAVVALRPPTTESLPPMDDPTSTSTTVPQTTSTATTTTTTTLARPADPLYPLPDGPLFSPPTGVVLVFDDGGFGVISVDPDNHLASVSILPGQEAGDQPYRLTRVGDYLAVGWGGIFASAIDNRASGKLSDAVIYIPAVEPDTLWMIDYASGRIEGTATAWQMAIDGTIVTEPKEITAEGFPGIGITGGVAVETDSGVALWEAASGTVLEVLTSDVGTPGYVADAFGDRLAWCDGTCHVLHITNVRTLDDVGVALDEGLEPFENFGFTARTARFTADGSLLAALAGDNIVVIDAESGAVRQVVELPRSEFGHYLEWSPDGSQIFASSFSYGQSTMNLTRYHLATKASETVTLPFGGALSFVVLDQAEAGAFIVDQNQPKDECKYFELRQTYEDGICGFHF